MQTNVVPCLSQGPSLFDAWYWYLVSRGWELAFTPMHATDRPGPIASLEETYDPAMPTSWPDRASPAEEAKQARHQVSWVVHLTTQPALINRLKGAMSKAGSWRSMRMQEHELKCKDTDPCSSIDKISLEERQPSGLGVAWDCLDADPPAPADDPPVNQHLRQRLSGHRHLYRGRVGRERVLVMKNSSHCLMSGQAS